MNHAVGAVAPLDLDLIEVGGAVGRSGAACLEVRCGRWVLEKSSYSRRTVIRCRWFQTRVRSGSFRSTAP
jgi:hypothetical protein